MGDIKLNGGSNSGVPIVAEDAQPPTSEVKSKAALCSDPAAINVHGNPVAKQITDPSGWSPGSGGSVDPRLATRLASKDSQASIRPNQAAQLLEHTNLSMAGINGKAKPGLFSKVTIAKEYGDPISTGVNADGSFYLPASLGMNRPITVTFEGDGGALSIKAKSSDVQGGASTGFRGIPIKTGMGEVKRSEDLKGALAFPSEPAQYEWTPGAPQPIKAEQAAQLLEHTNLSMAGISGKAKPGLFSKVTIAKEYGDPISTGVNADGSFYLPASLGMNRPITVTFEGDGGALSIKAKSSDVQGGASTGFRGIPIKTGMGEVKRSEDLKGALAFPSEPAEFARVAPRPFQ